MIQMPLPCAAISIAIMVVLRPRVARDCGVIGRRIASCFKMRSERLRRVLKAAL